MQFLIAMLAIGCAASAEKPAPVTAVSDPIKPTPNDLYIDGHMAEGEQKYVAEDNKIPTYSCRGFGRGKTPQLCLELLSPAEVPLGHPVRLRVRWHRMPSKGLIRVAVISAAPVGTMHRYSGPKGPITVQPLRGRGSGSRVITWSGFGTAGPCTPTFAYALCDEGQVGRYVFRARMFTGDDPYHRAHYGRNPPKARARSEAVTLTFTGSPRIPKYGSAPFGPGLALKSALARYGVSERYVQSLRVRRRMWATKLDYCSEVVARTPLKGRITVCFPKKDRDGFGVTAPGWDWTAVAEVERVR